MSKWISGDTNIYNMDTTENELIVEIVSLKNADESLDNYHIDTVKIPINYIDSSHHHVLLEQLQTNDLKHVGYSYESNSYQLNEPFKTMYRTQVKGTLNIFIKNRAEMFQS